MALCDISNFRATTVKKRLSDGTVKEYSYINNFRKNITVHFRDNNEKTTFEYLWGEGKKLVNKSSAAVMEMALDLVFREEGIENISISNIRQRQISKQINGEIPKKSQRQRGSPFSTKRITVTFSSELQKSLFEEKWKNFSFSIATEIVVNLDRKFAVPKCDRCPRFNK